MPKIELWHCHRLCKTSLFEHIEPESLQLMLNRTRHTLITVQRGSLIAQQNAPCKALLILIDGKTNTSMSDHHNRRISVEILTAPSLLAPAFLFGSSPFYPVDIEPLGDSLVMALPKETFLDLCKNDAQLLQAYLNLISSRAQFLSQRLLYLTTKTINEKIVHYLKQLKSKQNSHELTLPLSLTRLSELFAVSRPALSRSFKLMADNNLIARKGRTIILRDQTVFGS
jgi:CRP-like cAMP-binding protein